MSEHDASSTIRETIGPRQIFGFLLGALMMVVGTAGLLGLF